MKAGLTDGQEMARGFHSAINNISNVLQEYDSMKVQDGELVKGVV